MHSIVKTFSAIAGITIAVAVQADMNDTCPADLVNFWKTFAVNTENHEAIPEFLLRNECFRARVSTEFHEAMVKRFDHPDDPRYVDQLYAQLDWNKRHSSPDAQ